MVCNPCVPTRNFAIARQLHVRKSANHIVWRGNYIVQPAFWCNFAVSLIVTRILLGAAKHALTLCGQPYYLKILVLFFLEKGTESPITKKKNVHGLRSSSLSEWNDTCIRFEINHMFISNGFFFLF
jgi:hypothetical protein